MTKYRVMTVHGAKDLEAKNVILVDHTTTRPEGAHPPRLLTAPIEKGPPGATALIWGVAKDKDVGPMAQARQQTIEAACDEYRRLLYVALTRAADRLRWRRQGESKRRRKVAGMTSCSARCSHCRKKAATTTAGSGASAKVYRSLRIDVIGRRSHAPSFPRGSRRMQQLRHGG